MTANDQLPNVYFLAGKRRVRSIRHCDCFKKDGQCYYLRCRIGRRNVSRLNALTYECVVAAGTDGNSPDAPMRLQAVGRLGARYILYLDAPARSTIRAAIEAFESQAAAVLEPQPGGRVLPPLPEEFDRYYTVNEDSIDRDLLRRSVYRILHRPYFAMRGNTYRKWQLNPSRRLGLDFAADNAPALDFAEFLELFERGETAQAPSRST